MTSDSGSDAILVTGGSGFIGRSLVRKLSSVGNNVVSIYHHRLLQPMPNVYPVCSDLCSTQLLAAPLRGVRSVVFLAWGNNFLGPSQGFEFDPYLKKGSSNIFYLNNMIEAMEQAGTKRLIFLSAVGAARESSNVFLREKYFGEYCVLNSKIPEKVVLRSSIVMSDEPEEDRFLASIRGLMRLPWICPVPKTSRRIAPIQITDLCNIIESSIGMDLGGSAIIIEVNGKKEYSVDQFFKMISNRYVGGGKFQIKGLIGNTLVSLLERRRRNPESPKIRDFLALESRHKNEKQNIHPILHDYLDSHLKFGEDLS